MPLGNSSYLQIPLMAEADNQKYLLFNAAIQAIDDSLNRLLSLDFSGGDVTLLESQLTRYGFFRGIGHTVPRTLTIPPTVGSSPAVVTNRFFIFDNAGTDSVTLTHGVSGQDVVVPAGTTTLVYCDGTDIVAVASAQGFDMGVRNEGGADIVTNPTFLNFVGNGVAASVNGLGADIAVTLPEIQDEGASAQTDTTFINFVGAGVTATANGSGIDVTIPGGVAGIDIKDEGTLTVAGAGVMNYIGNGVSVADVAGEAHVTIHAPTAQDDGVTIQTDPSFLNFTGTGVTVTANGTGVDIAISSGGISGIDVKDEGTLTVSGTAVLNFVGNGVTVTDVAGEAQIAVDAPTVQDEGVAVQADPTFINFIGAGVTATASGNGVNVTIPGASGTAIPVDKDGTNVLLSADRLNFTGGGVAVTANGNTADIDIPGVETQQNGVSVVLGTSTLNFTGTGVTVTNPSGKITEINISGGGGSTAYPASAELLQTIDFSTSPAASAVFTNIDAYDEIMVVCADVTMSADQSVLLQVSTDNGTTFDTTSTNYSTRFEFGSTAGTNTASSGVEVLSSAHTGSRSWTTRVVHPSLPIPTHVYSFPSEGTGSLHFFTGRHKTAAAVNAIKLVTEGGATLNGGTAYIIGIRYASDAFMPWQGARVVLTADEAIPAVTDTTIPWDQVDREVGSWWSAANPTRLTVPSGVTRVRVSGNVLGSAATGDFAAQILKNGLPFSGMGQTDTDTPSGDSLNVFSDVIDVTPGDYFELSVFSDAARNVTAGNATWFSIEAVEGTLSSNQSTPVAFHAYRASTQAAGVVVFDAETLDEGSDYDISTGVFTAPIAGVYHFYGAAAIDTGSASGNAWIRVNGSRVVRATSSVSSGTQNDSHNAALTIRLNPGDTVDFEVDFAVAASVEPLNYFGGFLCNASTGNTPIDVVNETGTALNSVQAHANAFVSATNAAAITYTVDPDSTYNHDIGTTITIEQGGAGQVSIVGGTGVTIRTAATASTRTQYSVVTLTKLASNVWNLTGDLTP